MRPGAATSARADLRRLCATAEDPVALHRAVADRLGAVVPFDRWCGLVLDPATVLATGGYHEQGLPAERMSRLLEVECSDTDVNAMPALARTPTGVSTVDRATGGRPERSLRWVDVLAPSGLGRELRAVLRVRRAAWGGLVLLRETSAPDFSDAELAFVAGVVDDVGRAIRRCLLLSEVAHRDAPDVPGMAVLRVGERCAAEVVSRAASAWFADIDDGRASGTDLPVSVLALATRARRGLGPVRTRMRARSGRWVTLHAELLDGDRVSVVVEPIRPFELADVICDAYGLTPREREVARLAVSGHANREIAATLSLSTWTVQDHLKKVFEKLAVHSRAELVARLFFDQYLPRAVSGTAVGGDGWFITAPR